MNRLKTKKPVSQFLIWLPLLCSSSLYGQTTAEAIVAGCTASLSRCSCTARCSADAAGSSEVSAAKSVDAVSSQHPRLTQSDAEKLAIKNNPRSVWHGCLHWHSIRSFVKPGPQSCRQESPALR